MLQFFLKNFGEGITKLIYNLTMKRYGNMTLHSWMYKWLREYSKPPKEDVIKSASGIETEGYKHQLYFNYLKK